MIWFVCGIVFDGDLVFFVKMSFSVDLDVCFQTALELTKQGGEVIRNAVGAGKHVETKASFADLVTETDREVENLLISGFKKKFPDHKFIGEETTSSGTKCELTDSPTWIIDPVDGTMNFVHSFPYVAISIGLSVNKNIVLGIVYNPLLDKLYSAIKGRGAFCNGQKLKVSAIEDISKALILTEVGSYRSPEHIENVFSNYRKVAIKSHGIRSMGSAALNMCAVASGEAEAYFEYTIHCWDMAAGKIVVEEAGGVVIDPEGGELDLMSRRVLCASSKALAKYLSSELTHVLAERD